MPKSVAAALNSKNKKPNKSGNNKDSPSQDIQVMQKIIRVTCRLIWVSIKDTFGSM